MPAAGAAHMVLCLAPDRRRAGSEEGVRAPRLVRSFFMPNKSFGERLRGQETLYGGWTVIPDVIAAGALAASGLDYVVIDLQHGGATEHDLPALTAAIGHAGATP